MGEIAEMMLDGTLCAGCGVYIGADNGYPEYCEDCLEEINDKAKQIVNKKYTCEFCKKSFKTEQGLNDHKKFVHKKRLKL